MIRFLYLLVVAFFGVISATELSPTELKLMEQMLAVGFFLTRQIFILVLWLISYDKNSWDIALKAWISEQYWTRARWTRVSESGNSEPQVFISFFSVFEVSKKSCLCFLRTKTRTPEQTFVRCPVISLNELWFFIRNFRMAICPVSTLHRNLASNSWKIADNKVIKSLESALK